MGLGVGAKLAQKHTTLEFNNQRIKTCTSPMRPRPPQTTSPSTNWSPLHASCTTKPRGAPKMKGHGAGAQQTRQYAHGQKTQTRCAPPRTRPTDMGLRNNTQPNDAPSTTNAPASSGAGRNVGISPSTAPSTPCHSKDGQTTIAQIQIEHGYCLSAVAGQNPKHRRVCSNPPAPPQMRTPH